MTHGEDWDFIQTAKYLERADMTTASSTPTTKSSSSSAPPGPAAPCNGAPSSARAAPTTPTANSTFAQVEPDKVVEFLILNEFFPRSIRFCAQEVNHSLRRISGCKEEHFTNLAEKLAGRLVAELNYSALEDIKTVGMHKYMDELQIKLNAIGEAIFQTYLFSPPLVTPEQEPEAEAEAKAKTQSQSQKQDKAVSAA